MLILANRTHTGSPASKRGKQRKPDVNKSVSLENKENTKIQCIPISRQLKMDDNMDQRQVVDQVAGEWGIRTLIYFCSLIFVGTLRLKSFVRNLSSELFGLVYCGWDLWSVRFDSDLACGILRLGSCV